MERPNVATEVREPSISILSADVNFKSALVRPEVPSCSRLPNVTILCADVNLKTNLVELGAYTVPGQCPITVLDLLPYYSDYSFSYMEPSADTLQIWIHLKNIFHKKVSNIMVQAYIDSLGNVITPSHEDWDLDGDGDIDNLIPGQIIQIPLLRFAFL